MLDAPWCVSNFVIMKDLEVPSAMDTASLHTRKYASTNHPNTSPVNLWEKRTEHRRLKQKRPLDAAEARLIEHEDPGGNC